MRTIKCYLEENYVGDIEVDDNLLFTHFTRIYYPFGCMDYLSLGKKYFKGQEDDTHYVCLTDWLNDKKTLARDVSKKFDKLLEEIK